MKSFNDRRLQRKLRAYDKSTRRHNTKPNPKKKQSKLDEKLEKARIVFMAGRAIAAIGSFGLSGTLFLLRHTLDSRREKNMFLRILIPFVFICVCITLMVEMANYNPNVGVNYNDNRSGIVMSSTTYNKYYNNVEGSTGISTNYPVTGNDIIQIESGGNITDGIQDVTLTSVQLQMVNQYASIIEKASADAGVPSWALYAINFWEGSGGLYDLPAKIGKGMFDLNQFGTKHSTGIVVDYYTYGVDQAKVDNKLQKGKYIGPFQLSTTITIKDGNGDGKGDAYNFADAALTAAHHLKSKYNSIVNYLPTSTPTEILWIAACGANNSGEGGFRWRHPNDSLDTFITEFSRFTNTDVVKELADGYYNTGRGGSGLTSVIKYLDKFGWKTEQSTRDKSWSNGIQWVSPLLDISILGGYWPGDSSGKREQEQPLPTENHASDFFVFEANGQPVHMANNRQNIEYLAASYAIGTRIRDNIAVVLDKAIESSPDYSQNNPNNSTIGTGPQRVIYNWELEQMNNGVLFEDLVMDTEGHTKEGKFHEVGYKGNFPIFIQATGGNYVSNLPWKFNGNSTTIGTSGCSMFALISTIHAAGYGTLEIPNHPGKLPTFENISEILSDGPIVSNDVKNTLGYKVNVLPTETKEDFEAIWKQLEQGIPYIVNVNSTTVTAYDEYLNTTQTQFTTGGHFIILAGGYKMGDTRFVEVVQSTGSRAGQKQPDHNRAIFDFDELVEKDVIRSSSGSAVPAYTIVGANNYPQPNYMQRNYKPPTRVEQTSTGVQVQETDDDIIIDRVTIQ